MLTISPLYAGLLILLAIALSLRVSLVRMQTKVSTGDGGERALFKAIRVHSNAIENIPLGIIALVLLDFQGASAFWLHAGGLTLLVGRAAHAWGLGRQPQHPFARRYGAVLTLASIITMSIANITMALT